MSSDLFSHNNSRSDYWNHIWKKRANIKGFGGYYHKRLQKIYEFLISNDSSILEVGCGNGNLIGHLSGLKKIGIDISQEAINLANVNYPDCTFVCSDISQFLFNKKFDYIILSDLVGDLWDIQLTLQALQSYCHDGTRIIFNFYSKLWSFPLSIGESLGLKKKSMRQNWVTQEDLDNLLYLSGFDVVKSWSEILIPFNFPVLTWISNRILVKLFFFRLFALSNFLVAKPITSKKDSPSVSIIVAARNEAGHIKEIIKRVPKLGSHTELIFVEGGSSDDTYEVISREIRARGNNDIQLYKQDGKGKGNAVRMGFEKATGDILMILDADLTVPPEKLPLFYQAISNGNGEFINGVRLLYPMEKNAMRPFNFLGNKFFSLSFSWVLGQSIKDTLCGTKVLWKKDYEKIKDNRSYFGEFDPFGDFDLIFGAAKLNLKIVDLPIRYQERRYGETNISRWSHGFLLLRMLIFSLGKIKFV